jgi:hypothetical protein
MAAFAPKFRSVIDPRFTGSLKLRLIAPQLRLNGLAIDFERQHGERIGTLNAVGAGKIQPSTGTPHHESSRLYRWNR